MVGLLPSSNFLAQPNAQVIQSKTGRGSRAAAPVRYFRSGLAKCLPSCERIQGRTRALCAHAEKAQAVAACRSTPGWRILALMGTKSRESIYGSSVRHSAERAAEARKEADRLAVYRLEPSACSDSKDRLSPLPASAML
jgi:hypothetical protein